MGPRTRKSPFLLNSYCLENNFMSSCIMYHVKFQLKMSDMLWKCWLSFISEGNKPLESMNVFYFTQSVQMESVSNEKSKSLGRWWLQTFHDSEDIKCVQVTNSFILQSGFIYRNTHWPCPGLLFSFFFTTQMILHLQPGSFPSDQRDFALRLISFGSHFTPCVSHKAPHARTTTANLSFYRRCSDRFEWWNPVHA